MANEINARSENSQKDGYNLYDMFWTWTFFSSKVLAHLLITDL